MPITTGKSRDWRNGKTIRSRWLYPGGMGRRFDQGGCTQGQETDGYINLGYRSRLQVPTSNPFVTVVTTSVAKLEIDSKASTIGRYRLTRAFNPW